MNAYLIKYLIILSLIIALFISAMPGNASSSDFIAVSAGGSHCLALTRDGYVWSWGNNQFGQLGIGFKCDASNNTPAQVSINNIKAIAAGSSHSLALKDDGTVWAWGDNYHGMIGDGTTEDKLVPVQIKGLNDIIAIAAGNMVSFALKDDGTLWAWGYNKRGWLGDGTTDDQLVPVQVKGLINVKTIGEHGTFAIKKDGSVWAWGDNTLAELGNGSQLYGKLGDNYPEIRTLPFNIGKLSDIKAISQGSTHTIFLADKGSVYVIGLDTNGQLGIGNVFTTFDGSSVIITPKQINIDDVIAISAGSFHSMALKSDGTVWVWGNKYDGNIIGGGNSRAYGVPTKVSGLDGIIAISAGNNYRIALKNDGSVWTWGNNQYGQLGDGKTGVLEPYRGTPMKILGGGTPAYAATPTVVPTTGPVSDGESSMTPPNGTLSAVTNRTNTSTLAIPLASGFDLELAGLASFILIVCLIFYLWMKKIL